MDEGDSSLYIFYEHEESNISQQNVVQTKAQVNTLKKENLLKKKKRKTNECSRNIETTRSCKSSK